MSQPVTLITGFPGFIASRLARAIASFGPMAALVLPHERERAAGRAARRGLDIRLMTGDLTADGLGLDASDRAQLRGVARVFHLAAAYDLAVPEALARRVNVDGTRRVLELCDELPDLEQLIYFSTCYVAGARTGRIAEDQFERPARFRNHYESTKHDAEALVRDAMGRGLPATVVRPAIVVGDSRDGSTAKYDGPYFLISHLARLEQRGRLWLARRLPDLGRGDAPLNVVPVDHVVDAVAALARSADAIGETVQLADPAPMTSAELVGAIRAHFGLPAAWRVPLWLGRLVLALPGSRGVTGFPSELVDYIDVEQRFDTTVAQCLLRPHDITCPSIRDYLPTLVAAVRASPQAPPAA